jgi:uncharacterized cupin superfamily protein
MQPVYNINAMPTSAISDPDLGAKLQTLMLGAAARSERLYVNIDRVKPGAKSCKYHSHSLQEEFFLVLAGSGSLRLESREFDVKAGDFFAKPAGKGVCHQFINTGEGTLELLDVGLKVEDTAEYPDEGVRLDRGKRVATRMGDGGVLPNWTSDPNA